MANTNNSANTKEKLSIKSKIKNDNERGARRAMLEELFYDMYDNRSHIYKINFIRGVLFGFGSVLGGTILVAFAVWVLSQTVDLFPALAGFIDGVIEAMKNR